MTLTDLPSPLYYPTCNSNNNGGVGTLSLSTLGNYVGYVFRAPVSDTITKIGFRTGTINAGEYDIRVETVDPATGFPSGTLWDTNTNILQAVLSTDDNTFFEVTLTAGAAVNKGDYVAVIVQLTSSFTGGLSVLNGLSSRSFPVQVRSTGAGNTTGVAGTVGTVMSIYYQTSGYIYHEALYPVSNTNSQTLNTTSDPDIVGNKVSLPFKCKVSGLWFQVDTDGDAIAKLYDTDGSTVLASASIDADIGSSTGMQTISLSFDGADVTLEAGIDYYITIEPTTVNNIGVTSYDFRDTDIKKIHIDDSVQYVSAKDPAGAGDFTVIDTRVLLAGLIVSAIDDGLASVGSGLTRGMIG